MINEISNIVLRIDKTIERKSQEKTDLVHNSRVFSNREL